MLLIHGYRGERHTKTKIVLLAPKKPLDSCMWDPVRAVTTGEEGGRANPLQKSGKSPDASHTRIQWGERPADKNSSAGSPKTSGFVYEVPPLGL